MHSNYFKHNLSYLEWYAHPNTCILILKYHDGFQSQVTKWPQNPLDVFINYVTRCKEPLVIGDFGCGEANLARACDESASKGGTRHAVYSFDLVAGNDFITACDIANVPLPDQCLDLAIFCLSLMGTNFMDFLKEAYRVLKPVYVHC